MAVPSWGLRKTWLHWSLSRYQVHWVVSLFLRNKSYQKCKHSVGRVLQMRSQSPLQVWVKPKEIQNDNVSVNNNFKKIVNLVWCTTLLFDCLLFKCIFIYFWHLFKVNFNLFLWLVISNLLDAIQSWRKRNTLEFRHMILLLIVGSIFRIWWVKLQF